MASQEPPTGFPHYAHNQFQPPSGPPPSYQVQTTYNYNPGGHQGVATATNVGYGDGPPPSLPLRPGQTTGYMPFSQHGSCPVNYNQYASDGRPVSAAPQIAVNKPNLQASTYAVGNDTQYLAEATSPQNGDDNSIITQAMRFVQTAAPPPDRVASPLAKPVAIPHLTQSKFVTYTQPVGSSANMYSRMYSPALAPYGVSEVDFLAFLDGLNLMSTASQALQAVNVANALLSFDPSGVVQSVTLAAQIGLQASNQKIFDRRAARFLHLVNAEFFHPRRLHAQEQTLDQLRIIAHIPDNAPLTMAVTADSVCASVAENRARALQPWLAPLTFVVPPPPPPPAKNALQKLNNFQNKHMNRALERNSVGSRLKELSKNPQVLSADEVSQIAQSLRTSGDKNLIEKANKFEKKMLKAIASESPVTEKDAGKERDEEKATRRSKWLVVTPWDGRE